MNESLTTMRDTSLKFLFIKQHLVPAVAFFVAILLVATVPHTALAESGSIGGRPAHSDPANARTKSIFLKTVNPGQTVTDSVEVINNTNEKKTILIYATDSVPSSGGAFACAQAVDTPKSAGNWIKVDQASVEVEANSLKEVSFTITPPDNAEPGEQNGCIVLQEKKEASFQGGVSLSFRTAVRVAILIPGAIDKEISLLGIGVKNTGIKIILHPSVKNTGNVSIDADISTSIKTVIGTPISTQNSTYPLLRDQVTEWNFEMDRPFWGGFYLAAYDVSYDASKTFISSSAPKQMTTVHGQQRIFFVMPHILAALLYLIILAGATYGIISYRRHKLHALNMKNNWIEHKIVKGDNLQDIAKKHNIGWSVLAKANNIKPPYILEPKTVIKVPGAGRPATKRPPRKK